MNSKVFFAILLCMSTLLGIHSISKSFGNRELFCDLNFTVQQGARIGLIGPNGSGKTTLLNILAGIEEADKGSVSRRNGLRVGYARQSPDFPSLPLEDVLIQACPHEDVEEARVRARILLGKMQCHDSLQDAASLSGGWEKRLDIARSLMVEPDLLFLDEPTNHLDVEGIFWLETLLLHEKTSYILVSHDRYFLENVCTSIIELNTCFPGGLFVCDAPMSVYMNRKREFLEGQAQQERRLASTVRSEVEWLRRSPKARTTKSRSRIQKAYELIEELSETSQRNAVANVNLEFSASERETRKLLATKNLSKSLAGKQLFCGIDLVLSPGSRLGVVGKNGTGKTTFLKVLAGMLPPDTGTIKYAEGLKLVYFDQHREQLPASCTTLRQALSPNGDHVNFRGQMIHVNGWAKRFLFSPDRLELPLQYLSGGERARILIARLMLKPADILFLDEPTNDLDIPTLEVIEENLLQFAGAVVLISHDRCLMDRLCTQILGLGEHAEPALYASYEQWLQSCEKVAVKEKPRAAPQPVQKSKKLVYKEQRELDGMEDSIAAIEVAIAELERRLKACAQSAEDQLQTYRLLAEAQQRRDALFTRWQELEEKAQPRG